MDLDYDHSLVATLLKSSETKAFTSEAIAAKAHHRWSLHQYREAAALFAAAAERAQEESIEHAHVPSRFMIYYARAAITLNLAGMQDVAEPMLVVTTLFDYDGAGLIDDQHMVAWAFNQLILNSAAQGVTAFERAFQQAVERCDEIGLEFPFIHPQQEQLLRLAIQFQSISIGERLVRLITNRRPVSRSAKRLIQEATSLFQAASPRSGP